MARDHAQPGIGLLPPPRQGRAELPPARATSEPRAPASEPRPPAPGSPGSPGSPVDGQLAIELSLTSSASRQLFQQLATLPPAHPDRPRVRQCLVESHLPLVHHLAQRFRGRGEPYDDLVQVGTIGLLNAVDRFDPERGSFTTFAVPTILGEIRRHFRDRGWAIRVPRRLQDLGRRVCGARERLTHELGRSPTIVELAQRLDADPDLVIEALETVVAFATVPLPTASDEALLGSLDHSLELVEQRLTLQPLLDRLPARQRMILALRFGRGLSQSQIAAEVGISQMHVSRLLARSLASLREGLSDEAWR